MKSIQKITEGEVVAIDGKTLRGSYDSSSEQSAIVMVSAWATIGYGLKEGKFGWWALLMGIVSGVSVACIFHLRNEMEQRLGKQANRQPNFAGFDIEDVLYLFPIVTLLDGLEPLLMAATIGAPTFAIWVIWQFRALPQPESN